MFPKINFNIMFLNIVLQHYFKTWMNGFVYFICIILGFYLSFMNITVERNGSKWYTRTHMKVYRKDTLIIIFKHLY